MGTALCQNAVNVGRESRWPLCSSVRLLYRDQFNGTSTAGCVAIVFLLFDDFTAWFSHTCIFVYFWGAEALYVTCKLQNCTDANKGKPFPGYIDPNSLVVQDEYVFVQVGN